jgi:hypothetical protein
MSLSFKDKNDRSWLIEVNVTSISRVRKSLELDLLRIADPESDVLKRLSMDECLLVDVIYLLCRDQCEQRKLSDEDFGRAMSGEAIDGACKALLEGLADFFRDPVKRRVLKIGLEKGVAAEAEALHKLEQMEQTGEIDQLVRQSISGNPSTKLPESSDSTLDRSP